MKLIYYLNIISYIYKIIKILSILIVKSIIIKHNYKFKRDGIVNYCTQLRAINYTELLVNRHVQQNNLYLL